MSGRTQRWLRDAFSPAALLPGENVLAFERLRDYLYAEFEPRGPEEREQVERMLLACWRLRRLARAARRLNRQVRLGANSAGDELLSLVCFVHGGLEGVTLPRLLEHRRRLVEAFRSAAARLEELQRGRRTRNSSVRLGKSQDTEHLAP